MICLESGGVNFSALSGQFFEFLPKFGAASQLAESFYTCVNSRNFKSRQLMATRLSSYVYKGLEVISGRCVCGVLGVIPF